MEDLHNAVLKVVIIARELNLICPKTLEDLNCYRDISIKKKLAISELMNRFNESDTTLRLHMEFIYEEIEKDCDREFATHLIDKYGENFPLIIRIITSNEMVLFEHAVHILNEEKHKHKEDNCLLLGCGGCTDNECFATTDERMTFDMLGMRIRSDCESFTKRLAYSDRKRELVRI